MSIQEMAKLRKQLVLDLGADLLSGENSLGIAVVAVSLGKGLWQ